jgi:hypothetical protein
MILLVFFHEHTTMRSWIAEEHEHTTMVNKVNKATTTKNKTGSNLNDFFLFCIFVCTFQYKVISHLCSFFQDYEHEQKRATTTTTGKANAQLLYNMVIYTLRFTIIPLYSPNHSHTYT